MTIENTEFKQPTNPAITYSECYAQPFLLFNESNLDTMKRMPDNFIDLTVNKPTYDNLRDYKDMVSFDLKKLLERIVSSNKTRWCSCLGGW